MNLSQRQLEHVFTLLTIKHDSDNKKQTSTSQIIRFDSEIFALNDHFVDDHS